MMLQRCCVASLLMLASIAEGKQSLYHLPWACSVVHSSGSLVGACSIFDENNVLVSVDNFNEKPKLGKGNHIKRYFEVVEDLFVYAGSDFMNPERELPSLRQNYQWKRGDKLYVMTRLNTSDEHYYDEDLLMNYYDEDFQWTDHVKELKDDPLTGKTSEVEQDAFGIGIAFNIGILALAEPFKWTAWVQPILIPTALPTRTEGYIKKHESDVGGTSDTCITYSWDQKTNGIRHYEVFYLPKNDCLDVFCNWNLLYCTLFPQKPYHACFKSVVYADVCPTARGAALYCPSFNKSIFAILTTAPTCGQENMPGVYTTLPLAIKLYEKTNKRSFVLEERPKYDPFGLLQK